MNPKHVRLFLFVLCSLALPFARAESDVSVDVPPLKRIANDQSEYRRLTLDNGIKVILLSDPKLNKSSASLAVGVGSLSDPRERQGLAHFLEHMLLLSTEKYPDASDYGNYLTTNGGFKNAHTGGDMTYYYFEVRHGAFEGALDRFAQFFIAPLFTPEFTERELKAVNSEFQQNANSDRWRAYQLQRSLYREGHPANHFGPGNAKTLGGTTREELLDFYNKHYSADRMTLALIGRASLDQMEQWVRLYFSPIVNRELGPILHDTDYLPKKAALRIARMGAKSNIPMLEMEFHLPSMIVHWESKPANLLSFILGYRGKGGLLSQLKAEGLATGLSAGHMDERGIDYRRFALTFWLTSEGVKNYQRVLELAFATIAEMRRAGYPEYLFEERRTMAAFDELYQNKGDGSKRAISIAHRIGRYPLAIAEREPWLWLNPDAEAYENLLSYLRPDNMLVTLVAKGVETDSTEKYYGTKYSYREETGAAYDRLVAAWQSPTPLVAGIHLPEPNPYIPATATVRAFRPVRLINEPGLSLFYAQDNEFARPMVTHVFRFRLPRSFASLENAVALNFYVTCVREALNETTCAAEKAGLFVGIRASLNDGVTLTVNGYDESAARLLAAVSAQLVDFQLTDKSFEVIKELIVRNLRSFKDKHAYQVASDILNDITDENYYHPDERIAATEKMTLEDVRVFARSLYATGKIEALIHGNITADDAIAVARRFSSHKPAPENELLRKRNLVLKPCEEIRAVEKLAGSNSAMMITYRLGDTSPEMRAATVVLGNFVADPFYTELRTRQQLGYTVNAGVWQSKTETYTFFRIQSGDYPADVLEKRATAFIATLPARLASVDDAAWEQLIDGARSRLEGKDTSIAGRASRLHALAYEYDGDFDRRAQTLAALDKLTKERAVEILQNAFDEKTRRQVTVLAFARHHKPADEGALNPTFEAGKRAEWKKTRSYK